MGKSILIVIFLFQLAFAVQASDFVPQWKFGDKSCPIESETEKYIEVPLFYDLEAVAAIDRIPGLKTHDDMRKQYEGAKLKIFFELLKPYDASKESIIFIPGGPGQDHAFIHPFMEHLVSPYSDLTEKFNILVMDHRGVGCSKTQFPGREPVQSLFMRYAASDIESIRLHLLGEGKKLHVWGGSYGSMLAQTYALLYPDSVDRLYLWGAFSSYLDFSRAQRKFKALVFQAIPTIQNDFEFLESNHPELAAEFLKLSANFFYTYQGRNEDLPELMSLVIKHVEAGDLGSAMKELKGEKSVMEWMMRSITCGEIFDFRTNYENEFWMFGDAFKACQEFSDIQELFNYSDLLHQIKVPTFLYSGLFDHVTPVDTMIKMSQKLPDSFIFVDMHSGHSMDLPKCSAKTIEEFFSGASFEELDQLVTEDFCTFPPRKPKKAKE